MASKLALMSISKISPLDRTKEGVSGLVNLWNIGPNEVCYPIILNLKDLRSCISDLGCGLDFGIFSGNGSGNGREHGHWTVMWFEGFKFHGSGKGSGFGASDGDGYSGDYYEFQD